MTRVARSNFDGIECKDFSKCLPGGRDRSGFKTLHNGCKAYIKLHFKKIGLRISQNVLETFDFSFTTVNLFSGALVISKTIQVKFDQLKVSNIKSRLIFKLAISLMNNFASGLFEFAFR